MVCQENILKGILNIMQFKDIIKHYETLDKKELIKRLVKKNVLVLKQDEKIESQHNEIGSLKELERTHKIMNGKLQKEIDKLTEDLNSPLKTMREVGL